jgi:hypothetical protein
MRDPGLKGFAFFVIAVVLLISVCHFIDQMHYAQGKEFWLDEKYALKNTIKGTTYLGLLTKSDDESNAAPLDYLCTKFLDDVKKSVGSFGLSDKVYYRLWANFAMLLGGFVVVCLFLRDILCSPASNPIRLFQMFLLILLPFTYLYRPMTYHYEAEMRPYALWFALWLITVGVASLARTRKFLLAMVLSLLAMTMVGSIFQILSVGIAYCGVRWLQNGWKQAMLETFQIFTVPVVLVVFYAFPAAYGQRMLEPAAAVWHRYSIWWMHEAIIIPMLLVSAGILWRSKRTQAMVIGPISVLIVLLMGPLILGLTLGRGYFYTERQYIYYDAHHAVFWLSMINCLPFFLEKIKDQKKLAWAMALIFVLWIPFVFTKKTIMSVKEVVHQNFISLDLIKA